MARGALAAGATLVAISSGGELGATRAGVGVAARAVPDDILMPRLALGALVAPLFVVLFRMGMLPEAHAGLLRAQQQLARRRDQCKPDGRGRAQPGARAGAQDRAHHPAHLRQRRARRRRGDALEAVGERERQGARVLERVPRARPQRGVRLGPARRRHPPGVHPGRAAPRPRAPAARGARRGHPRAHRGGAGPGARRSRPRARAGSRSSSTSSTSATGRATTSRSTTTSTPARSTPSASSRPRSVAAPAAPTTPNGARCSNACDQSRATCSGRGKPFGPPRSLYQATEGAVEREHEAGVRRVLRVDVSGDRAQRSARRRRPGGGA